MEENPRATKRVRTTPPNDICAPDNQLHGPQLLLAIPSLVVHPPTHPAHKKSLCISLLALRRCLVISDFSPLDECRAWCALAEIGLCVLDGGFGDEAWAAGVGGEVEKALGKALIIAQKHPALAASYAPYLTRLSARAIPQRARQLLKPTPTTFGSTNATTAYYYTHLAWADHLLQALLYPTTLPSQALKSSSPVKHKSAIATSAATQEKEMTRDLASLRAALSPLLSAPHETVVLLARVVELRVLVALGRWAEVPGAIERAESAMGIHFPASTAASDVDIPLYMTSPFHAALAVHILVLGVVWFAYSAAPAPPPPSSRPETPSASSPGSVRLSLLYTLLDAGVYNGKCRAGVPLDSSSPPLYIRTTHPRVLYALGYLISAIARRDLVGRKPKRKIFVLEGLGVVEREAARELRVPRWASAGDVRAIELQMAKIRADLMCELIAIAIMRSEFDEAERTLDALIAHARTHGLFGGALAPRITLLHAQLAHARGRLARAQTCYRVAAHMAQEADDLSGTVAARAGEVTLLVGLRARARRRGTASVLQGDEDAELVEVSEAELERLGHEVAGTCRGLGGAMRAVGEIIEGVLTTEILKAKQHLKRALSYATEYQDNYLRALILALITSQFLHTAGDQAQKMLATCEQLAAGLGASAKKDKERIDAVGNAPLRLWLGERFLELHKRDGRADLVQKREEMNAVLRQAVAALAQSGQ
ncbi:hypothetical protein GGX14DRAFT_375597 [Mycena pura]|uniref:Uncharacterized protein n=1 Tax=Mycena pura TaxID=153505 RepID=A0AAD6Y1R1_9AGAR|nr:hypothetical protein GGX14DRAFT_375597 [Mycena pura]